MMRLGILAFALLVWASTAAAVQPDEVLADPALEKRAREISAGLRCLVCQNQSIDDSNAPLARDLRILVRERIEAGDSDEEVRDYLVARYGDFILLRPRFEASTLLLWLTPVLVLLGGGVLLLYARRTESSTAASLSAAEEERLSRIRREEA
jgi:cytochrome c-type biogenesis protein CcmH